MQYAKPTIRTSFDATTMIQRTDKGSVNYVDMINPNDPNPWMNQPAYEADE